MARGRQTRHVLSQNTLEGARTIFNERQAMRDRSACPFLSILSPAIVHSIYFALTRSSKQSLTNRQSKPLLLCILFVQAHIQPQDMGHISSPMHPWDNLVGVLSCEIVITLFLPDGLFCYHILSVQKISPSCSLFRFSDLCARIQEFGCLSDSALLLPVYDFSMILSPFRPFDLCARVFR